MPLKVTEIDDSGHVQAVYNIGLYQAEEKGKTRQPDLRLGINGKARFLNFSWQHFLRNVFLPAGYPATVSSDYIQCQLYYGIQAFCSSLASLIASRAVLEGHGIGKADASATDAMLLTILQDVFGRLTTILGAYYLGTSLYPQAKTYRLVADITNDVAIVFDLLSPHLPSSLRMAALCCSGAFRALCGVAAGGSRAAITLHFAQDGAVPGDVGDLSAKDASKETVLALIGMLCGSLIIPYLHTARSTHTVVFILLACHLLANYIAVRVVVMPSLNRQRAGILWSFFRGSGQADESSEIKTLTPKEVASKEYIFFEESALLRSCSSPRQPGQIIGHAEIGVPFSSIVSSPTSRFGSVSRPIHPSYYNSQTNWLPLLLDVFSNDNYILWVKLEASIFNVARQPQILILIKDHHTPFDHLKSWIHASELATALEDVDICETDPMRIVDEIKRTKDIVERWYRPFLEGLKKAGWNIDAPGLVSGSLTTINIEMVEDNAVNHIEEENMSLEERKNV